jgi:hypothetical protein
MLHVGSQIARETDSAVLAPVDLQDADAAIVLPALLPAVENEFRYMRGLNIPPAVQAEYRACGIQALYAWQVCFLTK